MPKSGAELRREQIRANYFPNDDLWTGEKETGWFPALRTLPLLLSLIDSKPISGSKSASHVYLELLSRMRSDGVIEMVADAEHAFAAGYEGSRAIRSWQERMKTLQKNGFIRIQNAGNVTYKYVALIHPTAVIQKLRDEKKVSDVWWNAYFDRKLDTKELTQEQRLQKQVQAAATAAKVVPFIPPIPMTPVPAPPPFSFGTAVPPPPPYIAAAPAPPPPPPLQATGTGSGQS